MLSRTNRVADYFEDHWVESGPDQESEEHRRGRQLKRTLFVASVLMGAHVGLPVREVHARTLEEIDDAVHERTVRRDLRILETMGLVECSRRRYRWIGKKDSMTKAAISAVCGSPPEKPELERGHSLDLVLRRLNPPWELTEAELRAATEAARIFALIETKNESFENAVLIFQLGVGWRLRRPGVDVPHSALLTLDRRLDRRQEAATQRIDGMVGGMKGGAR